MKNLSLENIPEELRAVLESLSSRIAALEREVAELRGGSPIPDEEAGVAEAGSGSEETIDLSLDDIPATLTAPVAETVTEPISLTVTEPDEVPVEVPEPIELPDIPEAVSGTETPEVLEDGDAAGYGAADDLPEATAENAVKDGLPEFVAEEDLPAAEEAPAIDNTADADSAASTVAEPVEVPAEPTAETVAEPVEVPVEEDAPRTEETLFGEIEVEDTPRKGRHGKKAAGGAVMDVMAEKDAWLHDIPGPEVKSLRSAIGLGDQILYIRRLFRGDSALYQYAIDKLNSMSTLKEAVTYVSENFPEWDPDSEDVYRFMMSVRRKIRK